eukprot:7128058-Prymnesium_polylepis.1
MACHRARTLLKKRCGITRWTRPSRRSGLGSASSKGSKYCSAKESALSTRRPDCSASSSGKESPSRSKLTSSARKRRYSYRSPSGPVGSALGFSCCAAITFAAPDGSEVAAPASTSLNSVEMFRNRPNVSRRCAHVMSDRSPPSSSVPRRGIASSVRHDSTPSKVSERPLRASALAIVLSTTVCRLTDGSYNLPQLKISLKPTRTRVTMLIFSDADM